AGPCGRREGTKNTLRNADYLATIFEVNLVSMYTRNLRVPDKDFWLLGPRDTGKSTWLRANFPGALVVDLRAQENVVRYEREPGLLRSQVLARPTTDWIV